MSDLFLPSTVVASGRAFGPSCGGLYPPTPKGYYPRLGGFTTDAAAVIYYVRAGTAFPDHPMPGFVGAWHYSHFWDVDYGRCGVGNTMHALFVGDGTATLHIKSGHLGGGDRPPPYFVDITTGHMDRAAYPALHEVTTLFAAHVPVGDGSAPVLIEVPLLHAKNGIECIQWADVGNLATDTGSWDGNVGFDGVDWAPLDTGGVVVTGSATMPHAI